MPALLAVDGRQYVYRVYAPADALRGDVLRAAFHCHDEGPHPRASYRFDSAELRRLRPAARPGITDRRRRRGPATISVIVAGPL
ncbi:hypothetical protein SSPS47_04075 [Streptomyces sp. S4.7]|uniref:hypothetical protein n=1 Tax=Streptomyces sp. S4.7 TaxID=2705439 RepID=UPI001396F3EF|nr:hypothetical protein [Streptomyces sp. S4.7]QHY94304.1 hypothetical protein SSPS47_04075 [Streptomyces sp. S4.7]